MPLAYILVALRPSLSTAFYCSLRSPCSWRCGLPRPQGAPARPPVGIRSSAQRNGMPSCNAARGQERGQATGDAVSTRHALSTAQEDRNSTPWCLNALKLGKQHRASALSRWLNSHPGRPGSLFKFHVIETLRVQGLCGRLVRAGAPLMTGPFVVLQP